MSYSPFLCKDLLAVFLLLFLTQVAVLARVRENNFSPFPILFDNFLVSFRITDLSRSFSLSTGQR